jgi:hypothetical protein
VWEHVCQQSDAGFSELVLKKPTKRVGLAQSGHHYHPIEMQIFLAMIWLKKMLTSR